MVSPSFTHLNDKYSDNFLIVLLTTNHIKYSKLKYFELDLHFFRSFSAKACTSHSSSEVYIYIYKAKIILHLSLKYSFLRSYFILYQPIILKFLI